MKFLKTIKYIDLKTIFKNVKQRQKDKNFYTMLSIQYTMQDIFKQDKK